mmetsp:Transcript_48735/g.150490  ORF Transcript_48735/g.150490 Transcript_48735/m.150490 type:complete len:237 (+) Transcript_48735:668-1378(+)
MPLCRTGSSRLSGEYRWCDVGTTAARRRRGETLCTYAAAAVRSARLTLHDRPPCPPSPRLLSHWIRSGNPRNAMLAWFLFFLSLAPQTSPLLAAFPRRSFSARFLFSFPRDVRHWPRRNSTRRLCNVYEPCANLGATGAQDHQVPRTHTMMPYHVRHGTNHTSRSAQVTKAAFTRTAPPRKKCRGQSNDGCCSVRIACCRELRNMRRAFRKSNFAHALIRQVVRSRLATRTALVPR